MQNVRLKITIPYQASLKTVELQDNFEKLKKPLKESLEKIKSLYIFTLPQDYPSQITFFYDDKTYLAFKDEIMAKNPKEKIIIKIKVEEVDEYPLVEEAKEDDISMKLKAKVKDTIESMKNSLIETLTNRVLTDKKKAYEHSLNQKNEIVNEGDVVQKDILCKQCFNTTSTGNMFICSECVDFTLCALCEACTPHNISHTFVMITQPLKDDLRKYNCCVVDNNKSLAIDSSNGSVNLAISMTLINNGIEKWEGCTLQSVTYGKSYLNGPKVKIEAVIDKLKKVEVTINSIFSSTGVFRSNWRVFNSSGVPFGELITFELLIH